MIEEFKLDARPICIVDVDLTVVDSVTPWLNWLNAKTGKNFTAEDLGYDYDLGKHFTQHWPSYCTERPISWWRYEGIYDALQPYKGAVEVLRQISHTHQIVFVSHCKGRHMKSKVAFLKRHFPFMSGFLATKQKHFVASMDPKRDIVIDDRNEHLNKFQHRHVIPIKMYTPWTQTEQLRMPVHIVYDWEQVLSLYKLHITDVLQPCSKCGITGIHACLGDRIVNHAPDSVELVRQEGITIRYTNKVDNNVPLCLNGLIDNKRD